MKEIRPADGQRTPVYPEILSTKHITILPQKSPSDLRNLPKVMMDLSADARAAELKTRVDLSLKLLPNPALRRHAPPQRSALGPFERSAQQLPDSPTSNAHAKPVPASQALQSAESLREVGSHSNDNGNSR